MNDTSANFTDLGVPDTLAAEVEARGYTAPTPIQTASIPVLLDGHDLVGHAPTGTGKTAAFGLAMLARIDPAERSVQGIILTPTRELAIQVAEALSNFATRLHGAQVLAVYGGQEYGRQIRALQRGAQIVVGTPGRVMDHLKRGNLKLDALRMLVLDEADEMLRMGFIDDVEWILDQTPGTRQTALFSATMPSVIRRIASKHLKQPQEITIKREAERAKDIRQRVWVVQGMSKLEALSRLLEVEESDGVLVFVRTRSATQETADALTARGLAAAAISGDMAQTERERTVEKLKRGSVKVLVATDVVARGLDVDRITHVINYDVPFDAEAYVHRIGRTGRAGRRGEAILFITPRERRLVSNIERTTRTSIEPMTLPDIDVVNRHRVARFLAAVDATIDSSNLSRLETVLENHAASTGTPIARIAAALAQQALGDRPLFLKPDARSKKHEKFDKREKFDRNANGASPSGKSFDRERKPAAFDNKRSAQPKHFDKGERKPRPPRGDVERFRVEVGSDHGVQASHIVGAIANEANMDSAYIGKIKINADHSTVELPAGMPKPVLRDLRKAWVLGRRLGMSIEGGSNAEHHEAAGSRPPRRASSPQHAEPHAAGASKPGARSFGHTSGNPSGKSKGKSFGKSSTSKPSTKKRADKSKPRNHKRAATS